MGRCFDIRRLSTNLEKFSIEDTHQQKTCALDTDKGGSKIFIDRSDLSLKSSQ